VSRMGRPLTIRRRSVRLATEIMSKETMEINEDKNYGELMTFLLQKRRHYGTDERFRAYVVESVRLLARDLRDLGLEVSIVQPSRIGGRQPEANYLRVGCE